MLRHLHDIEFSDALVAVLADPWEQADFILVATSYLLKLAFHLQVCPHDLSFDIETELLIRLSKLLLLLSAHAKQVLIDQRQSVALNVDLLLDLTDSFLYLIHVNFHAEEPLLKLRKISR